jgi:hypothetical protein
MARDSRRSGALISGRDATKLVVTSRLLDGDVLLVSAIGIGRACAAAGPIVTCTWPLLLGLDRRELRGERGVDRSGLDSNTATQDTMVQPRAISVSAG